MLEKYEVAVDNGQLVFAMLAEEIPGELLSGNHLSATYAILCRMGDPNVMDCVVWRHKEKPGGVFVIGIAGEAAYAVAAKTALAFSLAAAYFGDMVANVRYGADIFENPDASHD